jgi:hypothetical protein
MSGSAAAATLELVFESAGTGRGRAPIYIDPRARSRGARAVMPINCLNRIVQFVLKHLNQPRELVLQRLFVCLCVSEALLDDVELSCRREL